MGGSSVIISISQLLVWDYRESFADVTHIFTWDFFFWQDIMDASLGRMNRYATLSPEIDIKIEFNKDCMVYLNGPQGWCWCRIHGYDSHFFPKPNLKPNCMYTITPQ